MAEIPVGADVELQGDRCGSWRVINTHFDGLVTKYIIQSKFNGEIKKVFKHQIIEKGTSTYKELNEFFTEQMEFKEIQNIMDDLFTPFDDDFNEHHTNESYDEVQKIIKQATQIPHDNYATGTSPKRFKAFHDDLVKKNKESNTEVTTRNSTKWAVNILKEWMTEAEIDGTGFQEWPVEQLDNMLEMFYSCLQSKKGKEYSKQSLVSIRAGINRYLNEPPYSRKICLMRDMVFMGSNQVLGGK